MITPIQVAAARYLRKCGYSLSETADKLGVAPRELDMALWTYMGVSDRDVVPFEPRKPKRPEPMW